MIGVGNAMGAVAAIRTRGELHPSMKVVTDTFERHWYGYQDSNEADWAKFRDDYQEAIRGA